jgi:hypothetical protein
MRDTVRGTTPRHHPFAHECLHACPAGVLAPYRRPGTETV